MTMKFGFVDTYRRALATIIDVDAYLGVACESCGARLGGITYIKRKSNFNHLHIHILCDTCMQLMNKMMRRSS